jgi:hypothetical protein
MGVYACDICKKQNDCKFFRDVAKTGCLHFKQWEQVNYYGIVFADDNGQFDSEPLIAINKQINSEKDLQKYWSQIEPNLMAWGSVIDFTEYNIDPEEDDAELATYIYIEE